MASKNWSMISKLRSVFRFTCPKCHKGRLFLKKSSYTRGFAAMHKRCEVCGEKFEPEPGFYFGAAYVSYALTVALWVAVFVALVVFNALGFITFSFYEDPILLLGLGILCLALLLPVIYRLSRSIWIHFFIKFDREVATSAKSA